MVIVSIIDYQINVSDFLPNCNSIISETPHHGESELRDITCRICLDNYCAPDDPLINPCKCAGTMRYIHVECL